MEMSARTNSAADGGQMIRHAFLPLKIALHRADNTNPETKLSGSGDFIR